MCLRRSVGIAFLLLLQLSAYGSESLVPPGATWKYFKGTQEPSDPVSAWRGGDFDDGEWLEGAAGIGFGDDDDATVLNDMQDNYVSVYLRRTFQVENPGLVPALELSMDYDDGFVAYLNGTEIARRRLQGDPVLFNATATSHEAGLAERFVVSVGLLLPGANVLAIQGHNVSLQSSDLTVNPSLNCPSGVALKRYGFSAPAPVGRGGIVDLTLTGSSSFDLSAFSARLIYDPLRLRYVGESFVDTVWEDADFRAVNSTDPENLRVGVVQDTTNTGGFVSRGNNLPFVNLSFEAGVCTGETSVEFGGELGDNVLVEVNAAGHDVLSVEATPGVILITGGDRFVRGNANNSLIDLTQLDGAVASVTLADAIFIIYNIFGDGPAPPCMDAADVDNDGVYAITDSLQILQFLFNNSADVVIPAPFAQLGEDTAVSLGCADGPPSVGCP